MDVMLQVLFQYLARRDPNAIALPQLLHAAEETSFHEETHEEFA